MFLIGIQKIQKINPFKKRGVITSLFFVIFYYNLPRKIRLSSLNCQTIIEDISTLNAFENKIILALANNRTKERRADLAETIRCNGNLNRSILRNLIRDPTLIPYPIKIV